MAPPADGCAPVGEAGRVPALLNSGEVYRQHQAAVRRALMRLGVREAELDDATHDVFIVLLRRLEDYDGEHAARHWLMGIARRVASTYRRTNRRRDAFMDRFAVQPRTPRPDAPEAHLERTQVAEVVRDFLDGLDADKCAVFVLSEIKGLTGPEIADTLGVNLNTVYWRLRTARRAFDRMVERRREPRESRLASFFLWPFLRLKEAGRAAWHTAATATPLAISLTTIGAHVDAAPSVPEPRNIEEQTAGERLFGRVWVPTLLVPEDDGIIVFPTAEPVFEEPEPTAARRRRGPRQDGFGGRGRYVPRQDRPRDAEERAAVSRSSVFHTVRNHINEVRACYNQVLVNDPEAQGRVVVSFRVGGDGTVERVDVDRSEIDDAMFASCVAETVRAWSFAAAPDGAAVQVRYPFVLTVPDAESAPVR